MKTFRKLLKRGTISFGSLVIIVILAGCSFRLLSPGASQPLGQLVDIGDFKLHIHSSGEKTSKPTLVIEGGGGLSTEFAYWLNEGLQDSMRVVRYDRAGIGHSDKCITPRDPETIARELHTLLREAGESPPYIMMGHSIGGPYIRVFTEIYPDEVEAMIFLDATHTDQVIRYNAPKKSSLKFKAYVQVLELQAILADLGIIYLYDKLVGFPYWGEGLPDETNERIKEYLGSGKLFRGYKEEMKYYHGTLRRAAELQDFGTLPIKAFSAIPEHSGDSISTEDKPKKNPIVGTDKVYAELSTNAKYIGIPGTHVSIFTEKENANIICKEVIQLLEELGH